MIAYHGDKKLKSSRIAQVKAHRLADELIKGTGWENGKGCAVGCTLEKYEHAAYETELGIPQEIAMLEDAIFEGLPNDQAMLWPEMFLKAITPGADLSRVFPQFIVWLLVDPKDGVIQYAKDYTACEKAIHTVADLYLGWNKTGRRPSAVAWEAWEAAAWEAWEAAEAAAWGAAAAAWGARVARTARAAARVDGVAMAAMAARAARAARTARTAYKRQADKLLELLAAAPVRPI